MSKDFVCKCGEVLVKSLYAEGSYKLRGKVLLNKGDKLFSVCRQCSGEVELPIKCVVDIPKTKIFVKK